MKPGDWRCSICGDLNFASRTACRSCLTERSSATNPSTANFTTSSTNPSTTNFTTSSTNPSTANFTTSSTNPSTTNFSTSTNTNIPMQKPGDWHCNCGEMNFASRTACRKCGAAKGQPRSTPVPQKRPGDWNCPRCNELNFARNQSCRNCKTVPSLVGRATSGTTVPQKPGDWVCSCGELNFARNQSCRKCRSSKPMSSSSITNNSTTTATSCTTATTSTTADESGNQCVVCMAAIADTAITVCGHLALCMPCAQAMHACPLCRAEYLPSNLLKIFNAGV